MVAQVLDFISSRKLKSGSSLNVVSSLPCPDPPSSLVLPLVPIQTPLIVLLPVVSSSPPPSCLNLHCSICPIDCRIVKVWIGDQCGCCQT